MNVNIFSNSLQEQNGEMFILWFSLILIIFFFFFNKLQIHK